MKKAQIAIVGRTNVGKSTLFNKLIEKRISIISDEPNTTRDRIYDKVIWRGSYYDIVDTGGMDISNKIEQEKEILKQANKAINESEIIIFLVDGKEGLMPFDIEIAKLLRQAHKKVQLAVNKTEKVKDINLSEFYELGFGEPIFISALTGKGTGDLLDEVTKTIKINEEAQAEVDLKIAIVGKPNVGKSSLLNAILNEEKSIVSPIAHTTRESINSTFKYLGKVFSIVDTAGIRKKTKIFSTIERASIHQSFDNISKADVVFFMIDVIEEIGAQEKKLLSYIKEQKKGLIILINKWDLVEDREQILITQYTDYLHKNIKAVDWAPVMFISTKDRIRVHKTLEMAIKVNENRHRFLEPEVLEEFLKTSVRKQKPNLTRSFKMLRIRNMIQLWTTPPFFSIEIPRKEILRDSYKNFLENEMRKKFDFAGTPIIITTRNKENGSEEEEQSE